MKHPYRAIALDLFDTLVRWSPERLPRFRYHDREFPSTMPILIPILREAIGPSFADERWCEVYFSVIEEIAEEREREGVEITCTERFVRALERLGLEREGKGGALARELAAEHMRQVRAVTAAPAENVALVRRLAPHYRLAILSNFDDGPTGHAIVEDTGLRPHFHTVLISADLAVRKPNPAIFHILLEHLELRAEEVLFIGDTPREDVAGALSVGMPIVWLDAGRKSYPPHLRPPTHTLPNLAALPTVLPID